MEKSFKVNLNMWALSTDENHILHRIDSVDYPVMRRVMVKAEDVDAYEEVAVEDVPPYTKAEYDAKVVELVRGRYDENEECAITRKLLNRLLHPEVATLDESGEDSALPKEVAQFEAYNAFVEECKLRAKDPELYLQREFVPLPDVEPENSQDNEDSEG